MWQNVASLHSVEKRKERERAKDATGMRMRSFITIQGRGARPRIFIFFGSFSLNILERV